MKTFWKIGKIKYKNLKSYGIFFTNLGVGSGLFYFILSANVIKLVGSACFSREGRVTGNTHIILFGLIYKKGQSIKVIIDTTIDMS